MNKFKDLEYVRPDLEKVKKDFLACVADFRAATTFEQADDALIRWNRINSAVETVTTIAHVRNTVNTKDEFYDGEMKFFNAEMPPLEMVMKEGLDAMLASPFRPQLEEKYGSHMFKDAEVQKSLITPEIIPLQVEINNLTTEYSKTSAGCSVEFRGEKCNFYGLLRHMQSTDREERREAFLAWAGLYESIAPKLDELYGKLVSLRCEKAKKLGYDSFIDLVYLSSGRYDYDAAKVAEFREAVRKYVTPICADMYAEQAKRLGLEKLQWYDESLFYPQGNPTPIGTPDELVKKAQAMYAALSPETKEFFDFMVEHELYDFVTRDGKRPGGYCTSLTEYKAPFIFSNFNGTSADVDVLTHEAGHAFQYYYASRRLPLDSLTWSTSEINEIHSMTMEMLTYPYMDAFFGDRADEYRYFHFCEALRTIPYLVSVDEFQHKVFENPSSGSADWRRYWKEIEQKYMPERHYEGSEFLESGGFWMQKQHIFLYPFYYVDYALAQLGAFALYRMKIVNGDAWTPYLKLCALGGKYGYFETLEKAGIPNPLDPDVVRETADFAKAQAAEWKRRAIKE